MLEQKNRAFIDLVQPQHPLQPLQPQKKQVDISHVETPAAAELLSGQQPVPEPHSTPVAEVAHTESRVIPGKKTPDTGALRVASAYFWQDCAARLGRAITTPCCDGTCYALNTR